MLVVILAIAVSGTILANFELAYYYEQCDHVILLLGDIPQMLPE